MKFEKMQILNREEIERIDKASTDILENIGFYVPHEEMLSIAQENGANVDFKEKVVKVSADIIKKSIESAEKKFIVYGLDKDKNARFGYGDHNFLTSSSQYIWVDLINGGRFSPTLDNIRQAIIVADNLKNIDIVGQMGVPSDIDVKQKDVICFLEQLKYTGKPPYVFVNNGKSAKTILKMCEVLRGSKQDLAKYPFMETFVEPISPLRYLKESIEALIEFASYGLPIGIGPMAMTSSTAPCTLAGTLAVENADILSAVVLSQFINPGTPINYWGTCHTMDLSTTSISFGSPEQALLGIAINQLGDYYGFPVGTNTGLSDAILPDSQSGAERGITTTLSALAGSSIFGHIGICGPDQGFSIDEMIIEDEMIAYIKRVLKGFEVNDETIALDTIKKVGRDGNFLIEEHTLKYFKKDRWFPTIYNRFDYDNWAKQKDKTLLDKSQKKMKEILDKEPRVYLSKEQEKDLGNIVKEHLKEL